MSSKAIKPILVLIIFDLNGKVVEPLINNRMMQAGRYQIEWDGGQYASGMYFYSVQAGGFRETKKMVLLM